MSNKLEKRGCIDLAELKEGVMKFQVCQGMSLDGLQLQLLLKHLGRQAVAYGGRRVLQALEELETEPLEAFNKTVAFIANMVQEKARQIRVEELGRIEKAERERREEDMPMNDEIKEIFSNVKKSLYWA